MQSLRPQYVDILRVNKFALMLPATYYGYIIRTWYIIVVVSVWGLVRPQQTHRIDREREKLRSKT